MSIGGYTVLYHMASVIYWTHGAVSRVSIGSPCCSITRHPRYNEYHMIQRPYFFRYCPFLFKLSWHGNDHLITRRWNSGRFSKGAYFALRIFETVKAIKKVPTPIGAIQWVCISLQVGNAVQTLFSLIMLMKWDAQDQHVCQFAQRSG